MRRWLILCLAGLAPLGASAHEGATGIVKDRMEHMKSVKAAMKVLGPIFKGEAPYDAVIVREHAKRLSAKGGAAMTRLFPEGSIHGPSEALPAIWTDWDRFVASARELEVSAARLAETAANPQDGSASDPAKAFSRVVGTCRGCHDDFRKK